MAEEYKKVYQYVRKKFGCKSKTFLGVGMNVDSSFFNIDEKNRTGDTIAIFEDDYNNWLNFEFAPYYNSLAPQELCAIIHSCPQADMQQAINSAISNNIGFLYVTDRQMNNPFDLLPTYFDNLILYLASL